MALVAVLALAIVLGLQARNENARSSHLQQHGISVPATITNCVGLASGTGITNTGFQCHATFFLNGHTYSALLRGTTALYPVGQTVAALVDPRHPQDLLAAQAARTNNPSWMAYLPCALTLLVLALLTTLATLRRQRARRLRTPTVALLHSSEPGA